MVNIPITLLSQESINYHHKSEIIEFQVSKNCYYTTFKQERKEVIKKISKEFTQVSDSSALINIEGDTLYDFNTRKAIVTQKIGSIISKIEPVLIFNDGTYQVCNGELFIKLLVKTPLNRIITKYKFKAIEDEYTENQYLVKIENISTQQLFSLINELGQNNQVEFAEPNFTRFLKPHTNDPFFNSQWSINNQSYLGGTADADMDVDNAWAIATGQGVKVAIIDEGIDLTHPDLAANLLSGYDATGNNSYGAANLNTDDSHGTNCAGIISAIANNNIGVAGIAYNSKIIPIRIAYSNGYPIGDYRRSWICNDTWISNGINWAVNNGADILSNSWSGGSQSSTITNAINNAVNNGRNGKGCIVLFSSGNNNSSVPYPANLSSVIAVGATSMCDERKSPSSCDLESWWGSNYGDGLDITAPGVKIFTTDISGISGYTASDYNSDFNGTSSACPNAAGVVALILSVIQI